jgi:hypothetical protein
MIAGLLAAGAFGVLASAGYGIPRSVTVLAWLYRDDPYLLDTYVLTSFADGARTRETQAIKALVPVRTAREAVARIALRWAADADPDRRWEAVTLLYERAYGPSAAPRADVRRALAALLADPAPATNWRRPARICDYALSLVGPDDLHGAVADLDARCAALRAQLLAEASAP